MNRKNALNILLAVGMILLTLTLLPGTAIAADDPTNATFDISSNNITISNNITHIIVHVGHGVYITTYIYALEEMIIITGSDSGTDHRVLADQYNGNITLKNTTINSAFILKNGTKVNLILDGDNYLTGGTDKNGIGMAGIEVPAGCELTITSINGGSLTAKGGSSSKGGGAGIGSSGNGAHSGMITIKDAMIIATGGNGSDGGGNGSAIGSGGGNVSYPSGQTGPIKISGTKTDIITVSGGIGRGEPGAGTVNTGDAVIIIEGGNILILDQPAAANAVFKNGDVEKIYPISFVVKNDDNEGISDVLISNGSIPVAMTRENASSRLAGFTVPVPVIMNKYYTDGTATIWTTQKDNPGIGTFTADGYSGWKGVIYIGEDHETTGRLYQIDLITDENIEPPETPKKNGGGGSGTGSAKIVETTPENGSEVQQNGTPVSNDPGLNNTQDSNEKANQNQPNDGYADEAKTSSNVWWIIGGGTVIIVATAGYFAYSRYYKK